MYPTHTPEKNVKAPYINFKEVKSAISIKQIIERYQLTTTFKEKGDALSGTCPICKSESPRCFRISQEKNCFKCFSCDAGGNILDLVAELESCSIRDAALKIAEWFDLLREKPSRNPREKESGKSRQGRVKESAKSGSIVSRDASQERIPAVDQDEKKIGENAKNKPLTFELQTDPTHPWFEREGISQELVEEFGLGYCSKGMMAGRIVFPIRDHEAQLIGYAGMWIDGELPDGKVFWKYPDSLFLDSIAYPAERFPEGEFAGALIATDPFQVILAYRVGIPKVVFFPGNHQGSNGLQSISINLG